jgi:hypothetical protein
LNDERKEERLKAKTQSEKAKFKGEKCMMKHPLKIRTANIYTPVLKEKLSTPAGLNYNSHGL